MSCDVAIIGAGAAGIAAARSLISRGLSVEILEAGPRLGGRAHTADGFDHGASWLHDAAVNPLSPQARALGFSAYDQPRRRKQGLYVAGRPASEADRRDYLRAIEAAEAAFAARAAAPGDTDCASLLRPGPWRASAAHWLGDLINGAPLAGISVRDYVAIDLHGINRQLAEGLGTLITRLGAGLPVRLNTPVQRVAWHGPGVALATPAGTVNARAAIVTVSTGVLAAEALRFAPALPAAVQAAIHGLPLGLLSKVAMRLAPGALAEMPAFSRIERQLTTEGEAAMNFMLRPFGADQVIGFVGGPRAWALAGEGEAGAEAYFRAELAKSLGAETVAKALLAGCVATRWAQDACFLGAYTHARVGAAGARAVLREAALLDGRLRFAGEACHATHAATLGGAWASGEQAALQVAQAL